MAGRNIRGTPKALELNRRIICAKLDASIETIKATFGTSETAKIAIAKIRVLKSNILELPPKVALINCKDVIVRFLKEAQ